MISRRDFYRYSTLALGGLFGLVLAVPGVAYLLDPLRKRPRAGEFRPLARLGDLKVGVPRAFPVVAERQDAWVKYPKEPVGAVWLVRQEDDSVLALSAECPHLGCAVSLSADGRFFHCPCHTSDFDFAGKKRNEIPPRDMDRLDVEVSTDPDPEVRVRFQRFRPATEEKIPVV